MRLFFKKKLLKILFIIDKRYKILIIDNAREFDLKKNIEKKFSNVEYFISSYDIGLPRSYNYALNKLKKHFIFITQPDVYIYKNTIPNLFRAANKYLNFGILSSVVKYI